MLWSLWKVIRRVAGWDTAADRSQSQSPGTVVGESGAKYVVGSRLGSGAYATVYSVERAARSATGGAERLVLKYDDSADKKDDHEVQVLQAVSGHACFVMIVDCVRIPGRGSRDIIMERLDYSLNLLTLQGVATPESLNTEVVRQLLEGVAHMRRLGIVHKDVHFDNIMVDVAAGRVKYIDFGLARILPASDPEAAQGFQEDVRCVGEIALYLPLQRYSTAKDYDRVPSIYAHLPVDSSIRAVQLREDTIAELMSVFYGHIHNLGNVCNQYNEPNSLDAALTVHYANMMSPSLNGLIPSREYAEMVWALLSPYSEYQPPVEEILQMDAFSGSCDVDLVEEFRTLGLKEQLRLKRKGRDLNSRSPLLVSFVRLS